jgi:hypothetical protein
MDKARSQILSGMRVAFDAVMDSPLASLFQPAPVRRGRSRRGRGSKYMPHQGARECARRRRQAAARGA